MSFMHEVKYRGSVPIVAWVPTHAQPRPGLVEANAALKHLLGQEKHSTVCVLSVSAELGIKCVDTSFNPPKEIMSHTITEICHCGVDVSRTEYVSCIVGSKAGADSTFVFHAFKCGNKEAANKIAKAVASACTMAFQAKQQQMGFQSSAMGSSPFQRGAPTSGDPKSSFQKSVKATTQRHSVRASSATAVVALVPKLTDAWFRPSMSRPEVNAILKDARVGDFIVRESSTQPGDYAISVQTGGLVWTGLIIQTPKGLQLGKSGTVHFNELTDLVLYFMNHELTQDPKGNPVSLRLPQDQSDPKDRRSSFKNPPLPGLGSGPSSSRSSFSQAPSCGWPGEDEVPSAKPARKSSSTTGSAPGSDLLDEKAAFESIMNGTLTLDIGDGDHDDGDDDDDDDSPPSNLTSPSSAAPLQTYARDLFATVPIDDEGFADGGEVRDVLMRSGLEVSTLGSIWQMVDKEHRGRVDIDQFTMILGLISQAQGGEEPNLQTLNIDRVRPPHME